MASCISATSDGPVGVNIGVLFVSKQRVGIKDGGIRKFEFTST